MTNRRPIDYNDADWYKGGINMIDCDPGFPNGIMVKDMSSREAMIKSVSDYMDYMCNGTKVTDMTFAVFMQTSFVDCESMGWVYRRGAKMVEEWIARKDTEGEPYPFEKRQAFAKYPDQYYAFERFGIDWAQVAVSECRKRGVRPWIYFRMNDLHAVDQDDSLFHDPFFFKARENGWLNGNTEYGRPRGTSGRIENLYDYSHREVREWMLTYIEEMMMRYDVFGFGLDFLRNIYSIDYLRAEPGYQKHMTEFMRGVRDILKRAEIKHGHKIKLMARLSHTVEDNFVYGYDVKRWIDEDLVDMLVAGCEEVCNSGVDIDEWRDAVGRDFPLLIGYDDHIIRWADAGAEYIFQVKPEHIKGFTAMYYSRGVDGTYFNNFYAPTQVRFGKDIDKESSSEGMRTLVVTHQDIAPIGRKRYEPLPFSLSEGDVDFDINVGPVKPGEYLYLLVGYNSALGSKVSLTLKGQKPFEIKEVPVVYDKVAGHYYVDDGYTLVKSEVLLRYSFEGISGDGDMTVHFERSDGQCDVVYMELTATPDRIE